MCGSHKTCTSRQQDSLIGNNRAPNRGIKRTKYFCLGFFLSTLICFTSLGLSHFLWKSFEHFKRPAELCEKKLVGFFRLSYPGNLTETQLLKFTHVIFSSFLFSEKERKIIFQETGNEPIFRTMLARASRYELMKMFDLRNLNPLMISMYGSIIVEDITFLVKHHELDGVNIDWPAPKTDADKENLIQFCESVRASLNRLTDTAKIKRPFVISMTCPETEETMDFERLWKSVDFLNLDVSHFYVPWHPYDRNRLTGPASPLYLGHTNETEKNVNHTIGHYSCITQKPNRLVMCIAASGRFWKNVIPPKDPNDTLWMIAETYNNWVDQGWSAWRDLKRNNWNISSAQWSNETMTPYIWDAKARNQYHFENERSLEEKVKFAIEHNIGGVGVLGTSEDDDEDTLLNVFAKGGLCPRMYDISVKYNCVA